MVLRAWGLFKKLFRAESGSKMRYGWWGAALRVIPDLDMLTSIPVETFNRYGFRLSGQHNENDRAESGHFKYA